MEPRSSIIDRTTERRESLRHSAANDGSDEEDYALAAMGISDGFRPSDMSHDSQSSQNHDRRTSNVHPYRESGVRIPPPRPSSTSKPKYESFALRHDGAMGPVAARNAGVASSSNAVPSRSSSVSTDIPLRPESVYQGPTGPSHPYEMYPQESRLARTASMATTLTVPVQERSYTGPSGPTHPYGMYPQNTALETDSIQEERAVTSVPVGFPGLNNSYQRRRGPDGEDLAIISADGHTEELPPYTQYPDEAFSRKMRPMGEVSAAGAGGIGLAAGGPESGSREHLNSPRLSSRSLTLAESGTQINAAADTISEKHTLKSWQVLAKRKVCGIVPTWALVLAAAVLIIFGVVLGSVYAALKPKHIKQHHVGGDGAQGVTTATMTTTFDANILTALPTGISAIPTGTYALPIAVPSTQQTGCLQNSEQSAAWSCQIPMFLQYQLDVDFIPNSSPFQNENITLNIANESTIPPYGTQPPLVTQAKVMDLAIDSQSPEKGPAWFFQALYDKVVVVPDAALTSPSNNKRQYVPSHNPMSSSFMGRKSTAQIGQNFWICYWNGTILETFIYVNQTSSFGASSNEHTSSTGAPATATYSSSAQTSNAQSSYEDPAFLAPYPKVVKLQERRVANEYQSIPPYCTKYTVTPEGTVCPVLNSTQQPITIYPNETEPSTVSQITNRSNLFDRLEERDTYLRERDPDLSCGCVWLWT